MPPIHENKGVIQAQKCGSKAFAECSAPAAMSWVSVDPEAAHEHAEYTGLVILGVMTSSTLKKDHPSTFFECHLIASSRVSIKCHLEAGCCRCIESNDMTVLCTSSRVLSMTNEQ